MNFAFLLLTVVKISSNLINYMPQKSSRRSFLKKSAFVPAVVAVGADLVTAMIVSAQAGDGSNSNGSNSGGKNCKSEKILMYCNGKKTHRYLWVCGATVCGRIEPSEVSRGNKPTLTPGDTNCIWDSGVVQLTNNTVSGIECPGGGGGDQRALLCS